MREGSSDTPERNAADGKPTSTSMSGPEDFPTDPARENVSMGKDAPTSQLHSSPALHEPSLSTQSAPVANTTQRSTAGHAVQPDEKHAGTATNHLSGSSKHSAHCPSPYSREPMSARDTTPELLPQCYTATTTSARSVHNANHVEQERRGTSCRSSPHIHVEQRSEYRGLLCCGFVGTVLAVVALSLLVVRRGYQAVLETLVICDTDDCVQHAKSILATLDESVDTCADFHAHVCGGSGHNYGSLSHDTLTRAYSRQIMNTLGNPKAFLKAKSISSAAVKAFTNVVLCMSRNEETAPVNITAFMRARGIPWPFTDVRQASQHPSLTVLDVLLDLAVNWDVGLWFEVTVSQTAADDSVVIVVIGEAGHIPLLRMEQIEDVDNEAYDCLARNLSHFLSGGRVIPSDAALEELRADETSFRRILVPTQNETFGERFDVLLSLSNVSALFEGRLSSFELTGMLDKYLSSAVKVDAETKVLILNRQQFGRIARLMISLPARRLLNVIGWTFAYAYAWFANANFDFLSTNADELSAYVQCFAAAQESFGIAQAAPLVLDAFDVYEREKVASLLRWTLAALREFIQASPRIAQSTKKEASAKIGSLSSSWLWPPEVYFHMDSLDVMYANFSESGDTYFETWLQTKTALRAALASPLYGRLMTSRYLWRSGSVLYLHSLNDLRLSLSALFPPSYLRGGSAAMTYAGLGFQLARELVRTVDLHGRGLDRAGRHICWWKSSELGPSPCRLDDSKSATERRFLADIFALDVALRAMRKSSEREPDRWPEQRFKSLEKLSAAQTFYISYCSHHCGEPEGRLACNLAMNGSEFEGAFKCKQKPQTGPTCLFV